MASIMPPGFYDQPSSQRNEMPPLCLASTSRSKVVASAATTASPSPVAGSSRPPFEERPLGITNPRNDCFLISVFQCVCTNKVYREWLTHCLPEAYQAWRVAFANYTKIQDKLRSVRHTEDEEERSGAAAAAVGEYRAPQQFHAVGTHVVSTTALRKCFASNANAVFGADLNSQQDSHEALIKLMHDLPEAETISVVRTRYLRPTRQVFDELEPDTKNYTRLTVRNTHVKCDEADWDVKIELNEFADDQKVHIHTLLQRMSYSVLQHPYEAKFIDSLNIVRTFCVTAETYEWNNQKEPPRACVLYLRRFLKDPITNRYTKLSVQVDVPEYVDFGSFFWNQLANEGRRSNVNAGQKKHASVAPLPTPIEAQPLMDLDASSSEDDDKHQNITSNAAVSSDAAPRETDGRKWTYRIQSMVQHAGHDMSSGHFISYVRQQDKWFRCDDQAIRAASNAEMEFARKQAYLYFFDRVLVSDGNTATVS